MGDPILYIPEAKAALAVSPAVDFGPEGDRRPVQSGVLAAMLLAVDV